MTLPGKLALALSTQHQAPLVDSRTKKPEIIMYYNATKGGVDVMDSMIESYMGKPALRRWPTAAFFFVLGVAQINATTVLMLNRNQGASDVQSGVRRASVYAMGQGLLMPRVSERVARPVGLNSVTLAALTCVTGIGGSGSGGLVRSASTSSSGESTSAISDGNDSASERDRDTSAGSGGDVGGLVTTPVRAVVTKGRCIVCLEALVGQPDYKRRKARMTKKLPCSKCARYICDEHSVVVRQCNVCAAVTDD